jgi:hypothetical protein
MGAIATPPVITDDGDTSWLPSQPQQQPSMLARIAQSMKDSGYGWGNIAGTALSGASLPGDVATGQTSMSDPGLAKRVGDMASTFMGGSLAAPAEENALNMGIRAYHGSPHSFDAFDMSKLGTGEGAQAYGHGLYFADNENVAQQYRNSLGRGYEAADGSPLPQDIQNALEYVGPQYKSDIKGGLDDAISRMKKQSDFYQAQYDKNGLSYDLDAKALYDRAHDKLSAIDPASIKPAGSMYQVDIDADPDHFLDWDKPLSQQSPHVQQNLADVMRFQKVPTKNNMGEETTGGQMMGYLEQRFGNKVDASGELSSSNIPGIKYFDQGSRGAGGGSHNYVVNNDALVKVLKRYGMAGMGGAAGLNALANPPRADTQ